MQLLIRREKTVVRKTFKLIELLHTTMCTTLHLQYATTLSATYMKQLKKLSHGDVEAPTVVMGWVIQYLGRNRCASMDCKSQWQTNNVLSIEQPGEVNPPPVDVAEESPSFKSVEEIQSNLA